MDRGIQLVVFWIIQMILLFSIFSCKNKKCNVLKSSYNNEWIEEIDTITYSPNIKFLYLLNSKKGRRYRILGTQWLVKNYLKGDSIYKKENSPFAFIYRNGFFSFATKIGPSYCDLEHVHRKFDFKEEGYVSPEEIDSTYIHKRFFIKPKLE